MVIIIHDDEMESEEIIHVGCRGIASPKMPFQVPADEQSVFGGIRAHYHL
jgi:hypothetical protein